MLWWLADVDDRDLLREHFARIDQADSVIFFRDDVKQLVAELSASLRLGKSYWKLRIWPQSDFHFGKSLPDKVEPVSDSPTWTNRF
jgi:hypothetical protein